MRSAKATARRRNSIIQISAAWGQWSQGGMIMIGDMFNHDLKHRVSGPFA